jgi:hypothetical protein
MGQRESNPDPYPVMRSDDPRVLRILPHAVQPNTSPHELGLKLAEVELPELRIPNRKGDDLVVRRGFRWVSDDFVEPGPVVDFDAEGLVREGFWRAVDAGYSQEELLDFVNRVMGVARQRQA